jgi:hypothetical protein
MKYIIISEILQRDLEFQSKSIKPIESSNQRMANGKPQFLLKIRKHVRGKGSTIWSSITKSIAF